MSLTQSYNLDTFAGLEAAVQEAHNDWLRGNFAASFEKYIAIVDGRLSIAAESQLPAIAALGAADIVVIEHLADLARLFGQFEAASDLLEGISLLCNESGNVVSADYLLLKRIDLFIGFGKLDESLTVLEQMKPRIGNVHDIVFDKPGLKRWESSCDWPHAEAQQRALIFTMLYLVFGRILCGFGQYRDGITALRRGIGHTRHFHSDISPHLELQLSLSLAGAYLDKGELERADETLLALEPAVRSKREPWPLVRWLELSAKLNQLLGKLSEARKALADVYNICHRYKFYLAQLGAAMNFAHLLIVMNQTVRAAEILEETRTVAEHLGEKTQLARSVFLLDVLRARMRSLVEAVPMARSVNEMQEDFIARRSVRQKPKNEYVEIPQPDNYLALFEDRVLEFQRYLGESDIQGAEFMEKTTRSAFRPSDSRLIAVRLDVVAATLFYYQGHVEKAEALFSEAAKTLADLGLAPELWQVQRFLSWCWIRLGRSEETITELTSQTQELLAEISGGMSSEDEVFFLLNKWTTEEEFIAGQVNRLSDLKKEISSLPFYLRWRKRLLLMKEVDALWLHLENYKSKQVQKLVQGKEPQPQEIANGSFWHRLRKHPIRRVSIQFLVLPDRLLILRRGWLSIDFGVSSVTRIGLRELIERWHTLVHCRTIAGRNLLPAKGPDSNDTRCGDPEEIVKRCNEIARQVADVLQLGTLMKDIPKRIKGITFIPDDVLYGLPFAALQSNGSYLIERFAVTTAAAGHEAKPNSPPAPDRKQALLVHVARGSNVKNIQALPGARKESELIAHWLSEKGFEVERLADDRATKSSVLNSLPNCSIFHIACHGKFVRNRADLSGLILLPTSEKDELLSFVDLSKLNLTQVQHATLSSCWSADNFILPGRWIISLPEALSRAGVHSVLASLWPVDDKIAVSFMNRFFEYLSKFQRDEALRLTQLDCLRNDLTNVEGSFSQTVDTSDPFYWANFVLHGDYRKLKLL